MEPTITNTMTEQPIAEAHIIDTPHDMVINDTIQQDTANNTMPLSDIPDNTVDSSVVAACGVENIKSTVNSIADTKDTNHLKRERDDGTEDVTDDSAKRTCTDAVGVTESHSGPEVFARSRMALCESVPYYRAYKSSLYTQKCVARGFYMDGAARDQDIFKAQVVISSV